MGTKFEETVNRLAEQAVRYDAEGKARMANWAVAKAQFAVDDLGFAKLDAFLTPYLTGAVLRSRHRFDEDLLARLRKEVFHLLSIKGPRPNDHDFMWGVRIRVMNMLSNRSEREKRKRIAIGDVPVDPFDAEVTALPKYHVPEMDIEKQPDRSHGDVLDQIDLDLMSPEAKKVYQLILQQPTAFVAKKKEQGYAVRWYALAKAAGLPVYPRCVWVKSKATVELWVQELAERLLELRQA
jgi:hypothetical protein